MEFVRFIFGDVFIFLGFLVILSVIIGFFKRLVLHREIMKWGHPRYVDDILEKDDYEEPNKDEYKRGISFDKP